MPNAVKFLVWDGVCRPKEDGTLNQAFAQGQGPAPAQPRPALRRHAAVFNMRQGVNQAVALAPAPTALAVRVLETLEAFYPRGQRAWAHVEIQNPEYVHALFFRVTNASGSVVYQEVLDRDQAYHLPDQAPAVDQDPWPAAPDTSTAKQEALAKAADGPYQVHVWVSRMATAFDACKRATAGVRDEPVREETGRTVGDQSPAVWADTAVAQRLQSKALRKAFAKGKKRPKPGPGIDRIAVRDAPRVEIESLPAHFTPGVGTKDPCRLAYLLQGHPLPEAKVGVVVHPEQYVDADGVTPIVHPVPLVAEDQPTHVTAKGGEGSKHDFAWNGEANAATGALAPVGGKKPLIPLRFAPYTISLRYAHDQADQQACIKLQELWPTWDATPALEPASLSVRWEVQGTDRLEAGRLEIVDKNGAVLKAKDLTTAELARNHAQLFAWDGKSEAGVEITAQDLPVRARIHAWSLAGGVKAVSVAAMHTEVRGAPPKLAIDALPKWFHPGPKDHGGEVCQVDYKLLGRRSDATSKITFEVLASNHCSAARAADGAVTFTAIANPKPIYAEDPTTGTPASDKVLEIKSWRGASTATEGVLKPRSPNEPRFVNVAFSPYTIHLRYHVETADEKARLDLKPFWPQWDATPALVPDSLKVQWEIKDHNAKITAGELVLFDKDDTAIFTKALTGAELGPGPKEYAWDGKHDDGATLIAEADMPIRAQLRAWMDYGTARGGPHLALAAMHTEVRLFAASETVDPLDLATEPPSLDLELAPLHPKPPVFDPKKGTPAQEESRWYQWQLARAGYHPGPIDGDLTRDDAKIAIDEFQRSVPANTGKPYRRQAVTGARSAETRTALARLKPEDRPWFGDPADLDKIVLLKDVKLRCEQDPDREMVLWVEDRHCHTKQNTAADATLNMQNYRGGMSIADGRTDTDATSTARPWIPVQVTPRILRAQDQLASPRPPDKKAEDRPYLGPLRVDWTFEDLGEDVSGILADTAIYRSQACVTAITNGEKATLNGKDYVNCPVTYGGIRPATVADYYKAPFALGNDSLAPWRGLDDGTKKKVVTLLHDDLGQPQGELFAEARGRAGLFFRPSRIAGDGYRFAAAMGFDAIPGSDFPNQKVLAARYPKAPRVHSARLRLWRRSSIRGFVGWSNLNTAGWKGAIDAARALYRPAFVHFVYEGGKAREHKHTVVKADEFEALVQAGLTHAYFNGKAPKYKQGYVWPFLHLPHWGLKGAADDLATYVSFLYDIEERSWDDYSERLIHKLVEKIEVETGLLRGHVFVEFTSSPPVIVVEYECNVCAHKLSDVANHPKGGWKYQGHKIELRFEGDTCASGVVPACAGTYAQVANRTIDDGLPLCSIGWGLGATWLYQPRSAPVWAHEAGHHRHLQHAAKAPGFQVTQHDSAACPAHAGIAGDAREKQWDRHCIMSYTDDQPQRFCGKCLLRNRGWKVEAIANP